jgi:prophage regulatory protein
MRMSTTKSRRLIRMPKVEDKTGLSQAEIYRRMKEKPSTFPLSVATGPNTRAWVEDEIDGWIEERIGARDEGTDTELRAMNPHIGKGRPRKEAIADKIAIEAAA